MKSWRDFFIGVGIGIVLTGAFVACLAANLFGALDKAMNLFF
jgi:hypothetical protein